MDMKTLLAFAFLAAVSAAGEPMDGLYAPSDDAAAAKLGDYLVGERLDLNILRADVVSQDNANTRFRVSLRVPYVRELESERLILFVGGRTWRQWGSGSEAEKTSFLDFDIDGGEAADEVAAYFKVTPVLRKHPGHRLSSRFVPARTDFVAGDAKTATLRIENHGDRSVFFQDGGRNRGERDCQFVFRATDGVTPLADVGNDMNFGGISTIRELKPGETFEKEVDLEKWFSLGKGGNYLLLGAYRLEFFPTAEYTHVVWEDWATAEFMVRVKDKGK
jgi:hypothetical protein